MGPMVVTACLLFLTSSTVEAQTMQQIFSWSTFDFTYSNTNQRQQALNSGDFTPLNVYPIDVDISTYDPQGRLFVTTPKFLSGVPATLSTADTSYNSNSPPLAPYPDWSWHQPGDCDGMTSVFRVQIDKCGRLWVPDSGRVDISTSFTQICPAKVMRFSLSNDEVIDQYVFPSNLLGSNTLITNIAVDVRDSCDDTDTFAYIADTINFKLIVYDVNNRDSWVVTSNYFYPYPLAGSYNVAGVRFDNMDGILGLALSPFKNNEDRILYFHSLASYRESSIQTSYLRNKALIATEQASSYGLILVSEDKRPSQTAAIAMNDDGILFFSFLSNNTLNCWNPNFKYTRNNLLQLYRNDQAMQFVSGLKVNRNNAGIEQIWLISCRYQRLVAGNLNAQETNFYVLNAPTSQILGGNQCTP